MYRFLFFTFALTFSSYLFSQTPCNGASGQIIADSYYSTFDNYYQQCTGQSMTFICQNVVLPDNGEIQSIRWRINDAVIYDQLNDTLELTSYIGLLGNLYADVLSTTGCLASFQLDLPILFIETPVLELDETIGSCSYTGAPISANLSNGSVENLFTVFNYQPQYLDSDFDYVNSINVSGYDSPTITDCSILNSVFVNIEHSYLEDLTIELTCPNGTTIALFSNEIFVGGSFLGEPIDDDTTFPGNGYTYKWTQNADSTLAQWAYDSYVNNNNIIPAGAYLPSQSLCDLVGCPINGQWTLAVNDQFAWDNGNVFSWGLSFENNSSTETYDPMASSYNTFSWSSNEFSLSNQSVIEATAIANTNNQGTIHYAYTNSAGCQESQSKEFRIVDVEPSIMAGNDISFIVDPNPIAESSLLLQNSSCQLAIFDTTICYGNNADTYYTFCASDYFDCTNLFGLSVIGETENLDTLTIWEGTDTNSEPLYHDPLSLVEHFFSTATNCFTLHFTSDNFASCEDNYYATTEISLKSNALPNISINWEPAQYFTQPDSAVTSVSMPSQNTWATVTADIPYYSGCKTTDSLLITIPDNSVLLTVFHDINQNGVFDPNENTIPYFPVTAANVGTIYTNVNGQAISSLAEAISFEVNIDESQWSFTTPSLIIVDGSGWSGIAIEYFIGVSPTANLVTDIEVSLEGVTANCNVTSYPEAVVFNAGNYFPGGQIQLQLDPSYTFISSSPSPVSTANNVLVYEVPTLDYHETFAVQMNIQNPPAITFGTEVSNVLNSYYYLSAGNLSEIIDSDSVNQIVTCSYDPNNKITHTGTGLFNTINPNTRLEYTINFQNIGNAEAQTVFISDQLPEVLNPTTVQPIAWSHDFDLLIEDHHLLFTFENINLPGIDQDSAASMGFVRFTIDQVPDLAPSSIIENTAMIIFDLNEPIITNTAFNQIANPIGVQEKTASSFSVFPNPTSDLLYWNDANYQLIKINTMSGQTILVPNNKLNQFDMSNLACGIFHVEFISNDGDFIRRIIVKE
ncbi:MAG: hypothetical protein RLZZ77_1911 [Bacteroidota bacterium]|jgi:uncharacterized repeat protein (TIGR01451 family)